MPSDEQAILRANVRRLRMARGLSVNELAAKADIHPATISGNRDWGDVVIGRLAFALGVDVEQLFYYDTPSHEKDSKAENEAWEANLQKVSVYLRSIDDLDIRERESRRLLKVAESAAEDYDEAVRRSRARKEAAGNNEALPGGGGKGGAGNLAKGGAD